MKQVLRSLKSLACPCNVGRVPRPGVVLRSLKPLAFPFIRSEPPRLQRARPKSRLVRASFDPTACALIRAGPFFLVGFGWIWFDVVGFDAIPRIRFGSFFIISPISHSLVAARSTHGGRAPRPHLHGFHCATMDNITRWECQPIS